MRELVGGVVDTKALSPVPSAYVLQRAETMPDSNDVPPTVRRADGDVECVVSGSILTLFGVCMAEDMCKGTPVEIDEMYRMITR